MQHNSSTSVFWVLTSRTCLLYVLFQMALCSITDVKVKTISIHKTMDLLTSSKNGSSPKYINLKQMYWMKLFSIEIGNSSLLLLLNKCLAVQSKIKNKKVQYLHGSGTALWPLPLRPKVLCFNHMMSGFCLWDFPHKHESTSYVSPGSIFWTWLI